MAPGDESSTLEILPAAGLRAARPRAPRFPPLYQLIRSACAPILRARFDLEVSGLDRLGLLYDLTTVLSALNLNIGSAHIVTFGEKAGLRGPYWRG